MLLLNLLEANQPQHNKEIFKMFCRSFQKWRIAIANYCSIEISEAKQKILRIFFGGNPDIDLPFLWKLKEEVEETIDIILGLDEY